MRPTIEYIQDRFDHFNSMCFGGQLPPLPIKLSQARHYLGAIRYKRQRNLLGQVVGCADVSLHISICYDLEEQVIEDTILHEMIHYYILVHGLHDTSLHGDIFQKMMNDINQRYGRHITLSHRRTQAENASDQKRRPHYLCVAHLNNGHTCLVVCAKTCIFQFYKKLPRMYDISDWTWYFSPDPYFNRYPVCRIPKLFRVDDTHELSLHLCNATEMECNGRVMKPKKQ